MIAFFIKWFCLNISDYHNQVQIPCQTDKIILILKITILLSFPFGWLFACWNSSLFVRHILLLLLLFLWLFWGHTWAQAQRLNLDLCSGITPGKVWETMYGFWDRIWFSCVQAQPLAFCVISLRLIFAP